jgi:transglutaminase/protease-like cytokinesis protein 3
MNKKLRDTILAVVLLSLLAFTIMYQHKITYFIVHNVLYKNDIIVYPTNEYTRNYDFNYVQHTTDYVAKNKQQLFNIFYTIFDSGWDSFTFYCSEEYTTCQDDLDVLSSGSSETLAHINNFVAPYNSFSKVQITVNTLGKVRVDVTHLYTDEQITAINAVANTAYQNLVNDKMDTTTKIKVLHDYIIDNTSYDTARANIIQIGGDDSHHKYESHIAYGPLIQGYAICGGYTDAMAIFLNKMGIKNYRIMTGNHTWNYVYLDGKWYHLDLTWDDPVIANGTEHVIMHNFFLIDTQELDSLNAENHQYDKTIYSE